MSTPMLTPIGAGSEKRLRIGEVAKRLGVETYVLRFWEEEFPQVAAARTPKGQRYYTEEHVRMLERIRYLLYERKLTIKGARQILAGNEVESSIALSQICRELEEIRRMLKP